MLHFLSNVSGLCSSSVYEVSPDGSTHFRTHQALQYPHNVPKELGIIDDILLATIRRGLDRLSAVAAAVYVMTYPNLAEKFSVQNPAPSENQLSQRVCEAILHIPLQCALVATTHLYFLVHGVAASLGNEL